MCADKRCSIQRSRTLLAFQEKLDDQAQPFVGCSDGRSPARNSRYGSHESYDFVAPRRGRQCERLARRPLL
jgi:hypothetical protein